MEKKKVLVVGCNGRMGQLVCKTVKASSEFELFGGYDVTPSVNGDFPVYSNLLNMHGLPDVVIDFSVPAATKEVLDWSNLLEVPVPIVIATTGLPNELLAEIKNSFCKNMPIFLSSNMSYWINVMLKSLQLLAAKLPSGSDIEILEEHHRRKKDVPSGTAKNLIFPALNDALGGGMNMVLCRQGKREDNEIGVVSLRGGDVPGTHTVTFYGEHEKLSITHEAHSPEIFADGALKAASFLLEQENGLYDMNDMFD